MFAIGEAEERVHDSKVRIPREYNLRRRNRKIYGVWNGRTILYLSDETAALRSKGGKDGTVFEVNVDSESRITVPSFLERSRARIQGCISTIRLEFVKERSCEDVSDR